MVFTAVGLLTADLLLNPSVRTVSGHLAQLVLSSAN